MVYTLTGFIQRNESRFFQDDPENICGGRHICQLLERLGLDKSSVPRQATALDDAQNSSQWTVCVNK